MSGPDIRRALADHVEADCSEAREKLDEIAGDFAEAALDYGELVALNALRLSLGALRQKRAPEQHPKADK